MSWHLHVLKLFLYNVSSTVLFLGTTTFEDGRKLHSRERGKKVTEKCSLLRWQQTRLVC